MTGHREPVTAWLRDLRILVEDELPHARHAAARIREAERYAAEAVDPNIAVVGALLATNTITFAGADHVGRWAGRRTPDAEALFATLAALEAGHAVDAALHAFRKDEE